MAVNIGPRIGIEGEAEYRKELQQIIQTQKTLNSEMKATESAWDKDTTAKQKATQKTRLLNQQIETQNKRIEMLQKGLDESAQKFGENDIKTLKWKQALADAQTELNKLESELKNVPSGIQLVGQKFEEAGQKMQKAGQKIQSVGDAITNVGSTLTRTVTTPLLAAGAAAIKLGSDYEENINKVDVAFGNSAKEVKNWAKTATKNFGMSESAALDATSAFGDMATSMGLSDDEAAKMSIQLAGLAGDLSSFKNIDIQTAMTALKGVFTGETESLKGLGVVMTETNLKAFAEDMGLVYSEMSQAEKVTLRYQYVMEKTANAQGDYLRTSDGFANSFRTLKAEVSNLGASFGQELLPYVTPLVQRITEAIKGFGDLDESTKQMIIRSAGLAAAVGPVLAAGGKLVSGIGKLVEGGGKVLEWIGKMLPGMAELLSALGPAAVAFGLAAGAGAALGFALKELKDKYGWESEIGSFNEQLMGTAEAARQARENVAKSTEELEKTSEKAEQIMQEADAAGELTDRYAEELFELADKTHRTEEEQRRLEAIVAKLNKIYPGFTEAVLDSNGAIKLGTDDLHAYINELKNTAKVEAMKRVIEAYSEKIVEADMAVIEAEMALEDAQKASADAMDMHTAVIEAQQKETDALSEAERRLYDLQDSGTASAEELAQAQMEVDDALARVNDGLVEVNGETVNYEQTLGELSDSSGAASDQAEKLAKETDGLKQAASDAADKQAKLQKQVDETVQSQNNLIDSTTESTTATEENGEAVGEAGEAYGEYGESVEDAAKKIAEAQEEIRGEYDKTKKSTKESTLAQKDLWKALGDEETTTFEKMQKGLSDHHEALLKWNTHASELISSTEYIYDEGFRNMVNTVIAGGDDLAPELQVIYNLWKDNKEGLAELIADYGFNEADADKQAEIMAYIQSVMENGLEATNEAIKNGVQESSKFLGENFRNPTQLISDIQKGAAKTALKAFGLYKETGAQAGKGYGKGATSSTGDVEKGAQDIEDTADAGIEKVAGLKEDANSAGKDIGSAIASGARAEKAGIDSAFTSLRAAVSTGITKVSNQKTSAKVVGMQIVTEISAGMTSTTHYVTTAINGMKSVINTGISGISAQKVSAKTAGANISTGISDGINSSVNTVTFAINSVKNVLSTGITGIQNQQSSAYAAGNAVGQGVASGLDSASGSATLAARKVANAARAPLEEAGNSADPYAWGNHMGRNFADGVASTEGAAVMAARKVANAVAAILRHSTPKEGPLKDDDVWGLHLGQNIAQGMIESIPAVERAALGIADAAATIPTAVALDIDAVSGRNVAEMLTSTDIMDAFMSAAENIDWRVVIGNREFGRILREQGALA